MRLNHNFKIVAKAKMSETPQISLILPLYNAEKYLIPCLESVKNQTFKNFECLCINDGCSDTTQEIVDKYVSEDPRFVPIIQKNAGCSEARNTGIKNAKSPYIMLLDQDDFFHPQAMETLLYLIKTHNTDVAAFSFQCVDPATDEKEMPRYDIENLKTETTYTPFDDFLTNPKKRSVVVWTRIYNKDVIDGIFFPKDVQPAEDSTFTLKVFHRISSMVSIEEPLLYYRDGNETSVMAEKVTERYIKAHIGAARAISHYFSDKNLTATQSFYIRNYVADLVYKTCISQVIRWVEDEKNREHFIKFSHPMVSALCKEGVFNLSALKMRRRIAAKLFFNKQYKLARIFL